jgi:hypothetical protein
MTTAKKGAERHVDLSALVKAAFHEGQADAALRAAKILTKAFADRGASTDFVGPVRTLEMVQVP